MKFEEAIKEMSQTYYLTRQDISFIVSNGEKNNPDFSNFLDAALDAISPERYHLNNPSNEKKQFAKCLFNWIKNYNRDLKGDPAEFAKIVFEVYEDQRPSAVIKGRNLIKGICG